MKWEISQARFILSSKFEHSDSNLFRFLENSNLVHSKLKFELMRSNLLPCPPDMKIRTWCLETIPFELIALVQIRT